MKKKFNILGIILLSLGLIISSCLNVKAEENYTITIEGAGTNHKFEAYQVFKGILSTNNEGKDVLSNIVWGDGVVSDALLNGLKQDQTTINKYDENGATSSTDTMANIFKDCTTARDVAEVLALYTDNSDMTIAFAEVVSEHLSAEKKIDATAGPENNYTVNVHEAGYYFIRDTSESKNLDKNEFYTRYIMKVVKDSKIAVKGDVPTVEKDVAEANKHYNESDAEHNDGLDNKKALSAEIGEELEFTLTGTLPTNYVDYKTYKYIFHDTLSKGLTLLDNSIKLYTKTTDGTFKEVTESGNFTITHQKLSDGTTTLKIEVTDLKKIITDEKYKEDDDITLVVKYYAYLNSDAVIGGDGNTNTVHLEFSNDPNKAGSGKTNTTPDDEVTVFTYQLNLNKQDGKKKTALPGVGFKLYKEEGGKKYYAVMKDPVTEGESGKEYTIDSWTENEETATEMLTDDKGDLKIRGLEEGKYYLKESKTPTGYNTIEDVVIEITEVIAGNEEHDLDTQQDITSLNVSVKWVDNTREQTSSQQDGDPEKGIVSTIVLNMPGSILPFTGGMGTVIFYVIGFALIICSFIFVWRKYSKK